MTIEQLWSAKVSWYQKLFNQNELVLVEVHILWQTWLIHGNLLCARSQSDAHVLCDKQDGKSHVVPSDDAENLVPKG